MNEQLQTKLLEIITSIQATTKTAGDFAMAQLPDIAMQYVMYGRVKTVVETAFMLLVAAALFAVCRWAYANPWNGRIYSFDEGAKRSDGNYFVMIFTSALGGLLAIIGVLRFDWMVWLAPKVWLLKQLASLVQ